MSDFRIALAQINTTVGDLPENTKKILEKIAAAKNAGANLVVFPELALCGYPPEDLLLKPAFISACSAHLEKIKKAAEKIAVIVGFPEKDGTKLYNSAALLANQKQIATYRKQALPNYGVFDEQRYFTASRENCVFELGDMSLGITICEDIWIENGAYQAQASVGHAKLLVNISASPYHRGKPKVREEMLSKRAKTTHDFVAYCNLVGGQDELVFDGGSAVFDPSGRVIARGKQFAEDLVLIDLVRGRKVPTGGLMGTVPIRGQSPLSELDEIYEALILGTRDYIVKNKFRKVVLGLSGGIDSSLVATLAVDALGASNVIGVSLPSQYSSVHSKTDAEKLAKNLNIQFLTIPIESIYTTYIEALEPSFTKTPSDLTEENLQSRIRGTLLMALSNKFGWLVLTTGNKSEMSVGYSTLYGDMAGGFAVIKDVPKVLVYELCKLRNKRSSVIPKNVFVKPPSAELRPNQKDTDSLPEYAILDPILTEYIERNASISEIVAQGFDKTIVEKVIRLVDRAEYKRRQAPPGIKITERALGKDWRLPLTNHFVE